MKSQNLNLAIRNPQSAILISLFDIPLESAELHLPWPTLHIFFGSTIQQRLVQLSEAFQDKNSVP